MRENDTYDIERVGQICSDIRRYLKDLTDLNIIKVGVFFGTRPEINKMSPIIRECESRSIPYFTLHTGQHYS